MICWIGLNERNKLFLDDQVLAIDCTSFVVHNEFLIISTLEHLLKFISKKLSYNDFKFLEKENSAQFNEKFRAIELGARIITCVPSHINLVLQMPRGNLETICPRALVLSSVRQSIDKKQYKEAFVISRKHRIDLNLLIDHAPEQFKENASEIIMQIEKPDYLNLLVAGLKNEDVTRTMYQPLNVVQDELSYEEMKNSGKINAVCDLLRTALDENSKIPTEHDYTQTILTTFAKQEPPQLENALKRILEIKNQSTKESESALKYLIFLCDVDMLYDVALGIYDFPLVLMVAQYSQKDPREYLPFLSELQKLDTNYQRFSIDSHLKKYTQALVHLSKCDDRFEELVQFMKSNSIYKDAMKLFDTTSDKHTRILVEFAKFQQQKRDFEEAGILYQMASHYTQAIDCYIQGLLWKEAAVIITKTKADKLKHATSMIDGLLSINKYDQVARLYLDFLENPSMAVEMFAKGQLWNDAIMTAEKYNLTEMIDKTIKPELLAYGHSFVEEMQELKQKLETKALRLRKFRSDKLKKDEMVQEVDMLDDTASMATTRITQRTGYTGMTGFTCLTGLSSQTG
jgi:elongator complex protein 1